MYVAVRSEKNDIYATCEEALSSNKGTGEDAPLARPKNLRVDVYFAARGQQGCLMRQVHQSVH
jgi:hypothetical protein